MLHHRGPTQQNYLQQVGKDPMLRQRCHQERLLVQLLKIPKRVRPKKRLPVQCLKLQYLELQLRPSHLDIQSQKAVIGKTLCVSAQRPSQAKQK